MDSNSDETPPPPPAPRLQPTQSENHRRSPALREDCWSEESTYTLIDAWGTRHLALNRGNLRQQHWQEVAAAVNSACAGEGRRNIRRTDIQCKNRIDTLKKKYKVEKAKTVNSTDEYVSPWPFYSRLDFLISGADSPAPAPMLTNFPVGLRSTKPKRPAVKLNESFFRRNFTAVTGGSSSERELSEEETSRRGEREDGFEAGCRELANAIKRFGEVYERVEGIKQEQLIELEKHRMQFTKDLEYQRMKLLMDTQLQLAGVKRSKHSEDDADGYL